MRVLLILNWKVKNVPNDAFWKFVEMPALPPVGCGMSLYDDYDGTCSRVKEIWWDETSPSFFEVVLEAVDGGDEPIEKAIERMRKLGWTHESERPACLAE